MKIPIYQVDAFTDHVFGGNPAAVCVLMQWPETQVLQNIAAENNLTETAFILEREKSFDIRWFTPKVELDLAGHPTLAAAYVIFEILKPGKTEMEFQSVSGPLHVSRQESKITMDFPSRPAQPCKAPQALIEGLGARPVEVLLARSHLAVFETREEILSIEPNMARLMELDSKGVIVTSPGGDVDFVSRFFHPKAGIPEDPVTGSSHCTLVPYWAAKLGKNKLLARQLSGRGGTIWCFNKEGRVFLSGQAVKFLEGQISI
jgi:PhzF family phenazine biosynthesis protein